MKHLFILWLLLISADVFSAEHQSKRGGKVYAFIVADTSNDDIGSAVKIDVLCMKKSLSVIEKGINFNNNTRVLSGSCCSYQNILKELNSIHPSTNDIIIFYYSGHGFNTGKNSCWPTLNVHKNLSGKKILRHIKQMNKRSAIILFDCCNAFSEMEKSLFDAKGRKKPFFLTDQDNLSGLYKILLSFKGTVTLCAANVNEYAGCEKYMGSIFTRQFLKTLKRIGPTDQLTWDNICKLAAENTSKLTNCFDEDGQHPIYAIEG